MKNAYSLAALALTIGSFAALGCTKDDVDPGTPIGVQECDTYVERMEACLSKMTEAERPGFEVPLRANRKSFRSSAATPEGQATLKKTCAAMLESLAKLPKCN